MVQRDEHGVSVPWMFFHCHPCTRQEENAVNGKLMAQLLAETRKNTAYLLNFVNVVELWECEWKETRRDLVVKQCMDAAIPRRRRHGRWTMTSQQILSGVHTGTVFGLIECDVCVPEALREHFAEMQLVSKNTRLTRDDLGPIMRRYADEHIMATPRRMPIGSYRGDKILLASPLLRWRTSTRSSSTILSRASEGSAMQCPRPDASETSTHTRPSSRTP